MAAKTKLADSLTKLLEASSRPIYAVNARRQIVYCNAALADWLGMEPARIVGREVEYHSEPESAGGAMPEGVGPLAALCPPPRALAGEPSAGTVSCVGRDGRLVHRQAEFVPLAVAGGGVLVLLAATDLSPQDLATEISGEPTADELHRAIRRFRRSQAAQYGLPSLLGGSSAIQKARAQAAAAAASGANALIIGPGGSGRAHVARVIHYRAAADTDVKLAPLDCGVLSDDLLRRTLGSLAGQRGDARHRPTLLLENLEQLSAEHQSQLAEAIRQNALAARLIGTLSSRHTPCAVTDAAPGLEASPYSAEVHGYGTQSVPTTIEPALLDLVSTITIRLPRLADRLEDLPILAQYFLEGCNQGRTKQVGSVRAEALDQLALYNWPGELNELRDVIAAAHRAATTTEISPHDLPAVIHHATSAAGKVRRQPERIVLDDLLAKIERELIERALAQSGGNKTEAAALLGMTRPRLYRRLVQLGLAGEATGEADEQLPEFVERDAPEQEP
jgi:DNA-binding NtrC family response regulator